MIKFLNQVNCSSTHTSIRLYMNTLFIHNLNSSQNFIYCAKNTPSRINDTANQASEQQAPMSMTRVIKVQNKHCSKISAFIYSMIIENIVIQKVIPVMKHTQSG